jgi:hypothetical protein
VDYVSRIFEDCHKSKRCPIHNFGRPTFRNITKYEQVKVTVTKKVSTDYKRDKNFTVWGLGILSTRQMVVGHSTCTIAWGRSGSLHLIFSSLFWCWYRSRLVFSILALNIYFLLIRTIVNAKIFKNSAESCFLLKVKAFDRLFHRQLYRLLSFLGATENELLDSCKMDAQIFLECRN